MRRPLLLLLLLSAFAWAPLLAPGYFLRGHDAAHSLFWLVEFDQGIRDGFLWPRWAPDHALGYGYPLFTFYAPLAFYLAEIFHLLGASIAGAVKITWALACVGSGVTMYRFANRLWGAGPGLIAALLYLYAPYHLVNIYVRAALAEFVAFALFPWVLHTFWDLLNRPDPRRLAWAGFSFGLVLLTHSVTVIFFPPLLVGLILYWLLLRWRGQRLFPWKATLWALAGGLLGLALAAIFLLPAIAEGKNIVQTQWLPNTYNYATQYLYPFQLLSPAWGFGHALPGPDDGMSQQIGVWLILLGIGALPLLARSGLQPWFRRRNNGTRSRAAKGGRDWNYGLLAGFILAAGVVLLLTQAFTRPIWELIGPMALIQFPFRLLALADLLLALTAAGVIARLIAPGAAATVTVGRGQERTRTEEGEATAALDQSDEQGRPLSAPILVLALAVVFASYPYTRPEHTPLTERNQSPAAVIDFEVTYPDMRGSTAFAAGPPGDSPKLPAYLSGEPLPLAGITAGEGTVERIRHGGGSEHVRVRAATPITLQFYTFWYPGWRAEVNGQPAAIRPAGPDALITLDLPAGEHEVAIRFGTTPLRTAAALLSVLAAAVLAVLLLFPWIPSRLARSFAALPPDKLRFPPTPS